jgi:hypothetical protein
MENIFTSAEPFIKLSSSLGFFPMSFSGPSRKGFLITRWTDIAKSCFLIAFLLTINGALILIKSEVRGLVLLACIWKISFIIQHIGHLFLIAYQLSKSKNIENFLRKVDHCDTQVNRENHGKSLLKKFSL